MHINVTVISGNLGADPELRFTPSGSAVCNMRIANNRRYKSSNGELKETTSWHRVVVWDKQAEICAKYLKKGRLIIVTGRLENRSYEKDGQTHYVTEIIANRNDGVRFGPKLQEHTESTELSTDEPL